MKKHYILGKYYTVKELEEMSIEELKSIFIEIDQAMAMATRKLNSLIEQSEDGRIDPVVYRKTKSFLSSHNVQKQLIATLRKKKIKNSDPTVTLYKLNQWAGEFLIHNEGSSPDYSHGVRHFLQLIKEKITQHDNKLP